MMKFVFGFLAGGLLAVSSPVHPARAEDTANPDEQAFRAAGLSVRTAALVAFLRRRAASEVGLDVLPRLIARLEGPAGDERDQARAELIAWGPRALPMLREYATSGKSAAAIDRVRGCMAVIEDRSGMPLPSAAARLLAQRKAPGAAAAILAYLPKAESPETTEELTAALASLAGTAAAGDPAVLRGLTDASPVRRTAACIALSQCPYPGRWAAVRPLLKDPVTSLRLRAAVLLTRGRDAAAVDALMQLASELSPGQWAEAEEALRDLGGMTAPKAASAPVDGAGLRARQDAWAEWWKHSDGATVLAAVRKFTPTPAVRDRIQTLIKNLGSDEFAVREKATSELPTFGSIALPLLRQAVKEHDPETTRRAQECITAIESEAAHHLQVENLRLLAIRRPAGTIETLLAYLPFAENDTLVEETQASLAALAWHGDAPEAALVKALKDSAPLVRTAAATALIRGAGAQPRSEVLAVLQDPEPTVRLQAGMALAQAGFREAVPVLIQLLAVLPERSTAEAEGILTVLAGEKAPRPSGEGSDETRRKYADAWLAWWKAEGSSADLARLSGSEEVWLGHTLIMVGGHDGKVIELDRDKKPIWQINNVPFPVDGWVLPGNRVLIAEWNGAKVTERDFKGKIYWEKAGYGRPTTVQRLPNGHTFIATDTHLIEVDRTGKEVLNLSDLGGVTAGYKTRTGQIIYLANTGQCVRLDGKGKRLHSFPSNRTPAWTSGLDLLPGGRILITQPNNNKVVVTDLDGHTLREVEAPNVTTATGMPNGHLMLASHTDCRAWEVDRRGRTVWEYKPGWSVFRARRR
jgi:HEAT repeat protein